VTLVADFARRAGGEAKLDSRLGVGATVIPRLREAAGSFELNLSGKEIS